MSASISMNRMVPTDGTASSSAGESARGSAGVSVSTSGSASARVWVRVRVAVQLGGASRGTSPVGCRCTFGYV